MFIRVEIGKLKVTSLHVFKRYRTRNSRYHSC